MQLLSTKLTRFAPLGCQKFHVSQVSEAVTSKQKRPIAKISTLCTLELLILPTGAHFQAIWGNFEGEFLTFLNLFFVCGTPEWPAWQDGQCW